MHYFCNSKILSANFLPKHSEDIRENLIIKVEFTSPGQMDGHAPQDGDLDLDFSRAVLGSLSRKTIAEALRINNITGFHHHWASIRSNIYIKNLNVLSNENFCIKYIMEIVVEFEPLNDPYLFCADRIIESLNANDMKKEWIKVGEKLGNTHEYH